MNKVVEIRESLFYQITLHGALNPEFIEGTVVVDYRRSALKKDAK